MKNSIGSKVIASVVALLFAFVVTSCVNEEYELSLDRIDMNVAVFQEGISLPLGSTGNVTLGQIYSEYGSDIADMLQLLEGAYIFRKSDDIDVPSDVLDALSGIGTFDSLAFDESFSFALGNIDLSGLKIEGRPLGAESVDLSDVLDDFDLDQLNSKLPEISSDLPTTSIAVPTPSKEDLEVDFASIAEDMHKETSVARLNSLVNIPEMFLEHELANTEMDYEALRTAFSSLGLPELQTSFEFDPYTLEVPMNFSLPKEIKSVKSIRLNREASFELVFEIIDPLFTSGTIVPEIDVDLHKLLVIDKDAIIGDAQVEEDVDSDNDGIFEQHVKGKFAMSAQNGWRASHTYRIDSLSVNTSDWKLEGEKLVIDKVIPLTMSGVLGTQDLKTTLKHLSDHGNDVMKVKMEVIFHNLEIDDVQMTLNPIVRTEVLEIPIEISDINLGTDLVKKVEYFDLDPTKPLTLDLNAALPGKLQTLDINLRNLKVEFPEGMVINDKESAGIYDAQSHTLIYSNLSLKNGINDKIYIERIYLPDLVNNRLSYSGQVKVTAEAVAEGYLSSKTLTEGEDGNLVIDGAVRYKPELKDFAVLIDDYVYDVEFDPIVINEPISDEIAEIIGDEPLIVSLKKDANGQNPKIEVSFVYPEHPAINIRPKEGVGLKIDLPDMLKFNEQTIPESYKFDAKDNTMTFTSNDALPKNITLEIVNIEVKTEKAADGSGYVISDEMSVTGGVCLKGTTVCRSDVQEIQQMENAVVAFSGNIPDIEPAQFGLREYEKTIEENIEIAKIEAEIPSEINSIRMQEILLKDTYLNLLVDASSVKNIIDKVDMTVSVDITLPEIFMIETDGSGATFENHVLSIRKSLDKDYRLTVDGVRIKGFDLSGVSVKDGKLTVELPEIPIRGTVRLENLSVDLASLEGQTLGVDIAGSIASADENGQASETIAIDKITGYVGAQIDPIRTTVDLSSYADALNDGNMDLTVDLYTYYLTLDIHNNIDIPLAGNLEVVPYFGNTPGTSANPAIVLDPAERKNDCYSIFVSNLDPNSPASEGRYDVYKDSQYVGLDLISMLYKEVEGEKPVMADSVQITVNARTDSEKLCTLEPSKEYNLAVEYEIGIPLELGEGFAFEYRDTITGLPEEAKKIFEYGSVGLTGKFINGLPLNLDLQVVPLDENDNVITLSEEVGKQRISSCDKEGNPVTTDLHFILSGKGADLSKMAAVEVIVKADAKGAAGVPLREDSFVKVSLNALIPEGVTVDAREFLEEMSEEE